jgi:two-component system response regulator AtoC
LIDGNAIASGAPATLERGQPFTVGPFTCVVVSERRAQHAAPSALRVDDPNPRVPPPLLTTVAVSSLPVLIRGETGVGKELLAETLHRLSGRGGRLVRINCASFSPELLESELFGHERGAFTGAVATRKGLLETAAGGSVFLDEIGEMPMPLQARLLRAIEAREIVRVGGADSVPVDVRFIAATNRDLPAEIAREAFRLDLYYRLAVVTLTIPPLRERRDRLPSLATELLRAAAARSSAPVPALSAAVIARLQAHDWPGNVRELRNAIERAFLLSGGQDLQPVHVVLDAPEVAARAAPPSDVPARGEDDDERQRIIDALQACAGNQTRAARMLGMARSTLAAKLVIHGIPRPQR